MALPNFSPESWIVYATAFILIPILTIIIVIQSYSQRKLNPREPTVLAPAIPVIGHIIGMAIFGGRYIKNLGIRHRDLPIFTLPVPGSRIYIVADPSLAVAVQRASKVLSFTPIIPEVTERVLGLDAATMEITRKNLDPGPGEERGFLADIQDMVYVQLGPGSYLEELSLAAAHEIQDEIASVTTQPTSPIDLLSWVRHLVTVSTAKYLYGPQNPIAVDPSLETSFWDFDHGLGSLLMNIYPSITAPKAYLGREKLSAALLVYLEAGLHKKGSSIVQRRVEIAQQHGWALPAIAREELSFLFAGIVNATTSTFWILVHLYADPSLLASVREEVQAVLETPKLDSTSGRARLYLTDLRDTCPVLVAVYRECLRLGSDTYSTRLVKQDHILANQYFLAKNSVVQIAGGVIHADSRIWGEDVDSFNPKRFLVTKEGGVGKENGGVGGVVKQKQNNAFHPAAFRAFGGGKTLCPGRHFAMNEILAFVALVVLQFDMKPAHGDKIEVPRKNDGVLPVHILEPVCPVEVLISRREDSVARKARKAKFSM
ncbi:cytochrome P450 [Annulohypoxylon maeteangense]|uniref:cytochrome P450 n=1 Tax=Annulohypoxylon maeteangense TaxID=1927788 RepID=UPI002007EE41|nr:cytochrome P450 [Annulohypoxylon maeteangense]KAI0888199.1 cytochrome P450 [Annulohypoxylon maeteangense]